MKVLTIIGARPQFIKASVVSKAIAASAGLKEVIVHTGQHFDANMSDVFFKQLKIPAPDYQLDIHGGNHGEMTGRMLAEIEQVIIKEQPDRVLVYGDTNSTLAGALAASKLHIPVAHVEAGLRSFNRRMPEEINRVLTDHLSDLLLCPTDTAIHNLSLEGITPATARVVNVGDVMLDSALFFSQVATAPQWLANTQVLDSRLLDGDGTSIRNGSFILATLHRAENTDDLNRLQSLVSGLNHIHDTLAPVIMPVHPRTRAAISKAGLDLKVQVIEPVGYMEMLWMLKRCGLVLTDSGGLQKEAFFLKKQCVTMRDQTEWVELVDLGVNVLVGADYAQLVEQAAKSFGKAVAVDSKPYGDGDAASRVVAAIQETQGA